jgi:hypothetical protein
VREELGPPPNPFAELPPLLPEDDSRGLVSLFVIIAGSALGGLLTAAALMYGSKYINNRWNPFRRRFRRRS